MEDELDMETQLERELAAEQEELLEVGEDEEEEEEDEEDDVDDNPEEEEDEDNEEGDGGIMANGKNSEENMEHRMSDVADNSKTKLGGSANSQDMKTSRDSEDVQRYTEIDTNEEKDRRPIPILEVTGSSSDSRIEITSQDPAIESSTYEINKVQKKITEDEEKNDSGKPTLAKVRSLPSNFTYNPPGGADGARRKIDGQFISLACFYISN